MDVEKMTLIIGELQPHLIAGVTASDLADMLLEKAETHKLTTKELVLITFFLGNTGVRQVDEE